MSIIHTSAVVAVILAMTLSAGCGSSANGPSLGSPSPSISSTPALSTPAPSAGSPSPPRRSAKKPPAPTGTKITSASSDFGPMLWGPKRQAIYIWEREPSATPQCYGSCATAWPPVLTDGKPVAAGDVNPKLLGTTKRRDGSAQVTYNGHPLYFYENEGPGEVKCHNIRTHGGLWWVITPQGRRAD